MASSRWFLAPRGPATARLVNGDGALSVPSLNLKDPDGEAAMAAVKGKVLAEGEQLGLYTQNPEKGAKVPQ
jgi:hypothetical protein